MKTVKFAISLVLGLASISSAFAETTLNGHISQIDTGSTLSAVATIDATKVTGSPVLNAQALATVNTIKVSSTTGMTISGSDITQTATNTSSITKAGITTATISASHTPITNLVMSNSINEITGTVVSATAK